MSFVFCHIILPWSFDYEGQTSICPGQVFLTVKKSGEFYFPDETCSHEVMELSPLRTHHSHTSSVVSSTKGIRVFNLSTKDWIIVVMLNNSHVILDDRFKNMHIVKYDTPALQRCLSRKLYVTHLYLWHRAPVRRKSPCCYAPTLWGND